MVSFLKSGKPHGREQKCFLFPLFFCNKIKSPTPGPSPAGRGVDTVVFCALLSNCSVTRNFVLRFIAERSCRSLWRPRRSLSKQIQQ